MDRKSFKILFCLQLGRMHITVFLLLTLKASRNAFPEPQIGGSAPPQTPSMGITHVPLWLHLPVWTEIMYSLLRSTMAAPLFFQSSQQCLEWASSVDSGTKLIYNFLVLSGRKNDYKNFGESPGWCGSVDWVPTCEPKGRWFDS